MTDIPTPLFVEKTTSTNTCLAQWCDKEQLPDLTCVYTSYQTAGRGQRGNHWESEPGANLLFSFVCYPSFLEARRQFFLSQVTALGVAEVLSTYAEGIRIKWPNDIYWQDLKIGGTLIENDLTGTGISRSISGTGINLNQQKFVSDAPNPVSLTQITGERYDPAEVLRPIMERISRHYQALKDGLSEEIAESYKRFLYRKDGFYPYRDCDGRFLARICDIEPSGRIVLDDSNGRRRKYAFKEVSFEL